ncbi:MAG: MmgE/PrpD family protein [Calditrichaceae bacterium]|nr:MmgE/PrpD family protein [Calditrichia bacterium]NUQ44200.1 MmgE/PrpD family protein [Calditrichaceae bacterium]
MEYITHKIADYALNLKYQDLSPEAVKEVKRYLLDSAGCAYGGSVTKDVNIYIDYYQHLGGKPEASIFNSKLKFPNEHATLLNALMIRALDYNDIYWEEDPSHPSDIIPAALTPAEILGKSGRELIVAIILAYEFEMRMCEIAHPGIRERKWHHATLTAFVSPIVAGKIMGLSKEQMVHAIGISASKHATFGCVTAGHLTMMKNTVDPLATQSGVIAAELAQRGYEGPAHAIEGKEGMVQTIVGGAWDVEGLVRGLGKDPYRILRCSMKAFPTEALTHSPFSALLKIRREHEIASKDIEEITIKTVARAADILSDPSKYHPTTRETADHSLPYCVAALILDGKLTSEQFTDERINAPDIRDMIHRVKVLAEPRYEKMFPAKKPAGAVIRTKDGRSFAAEVDFPKGDYRNPLSDEEITVKFDSMVLDKISQSKRDRMVDMIWNLEEVKDVRELMKAFAGQ